MLDSGDVMDLFRMSKSTLWRHVKEERFPPPIYIGRTPLWHQSTLERWLGQQHGVDANRSADAQAKKRDLDEFA